MELRQLRYLCAVADHGSFTAAAAACSIAQPSLSQQILNLEEEMGQPFFIRHPRHVELTEAGRSVLLRARAILAESEALQGEMQRRAQLVEGCIHFGVIPTVAPYLLPEYIRRFQQAHPGVRIHVREGRTSRLIDELVKGRLDFAIASDITATDKQRWSLHVKELLREKLLLALPETHPLAERTSGVALKEVPKDQLIILSEGHCLADQILSVCRIRRSEDRLECEQLETLLAMVGAGLGIAIVPEMAVRHVVMKGFVFRRFKTPEPTRLISIVKRRAVTPSPAAAALLAEFTGKT